MAKDLCPGGGVAIARSDQVPPSSKIHYYGFFFYVMERRIKRIRLTCPVCKRRVLSSIRLGHDEDYILHTLPPHKPKHWWKRKEIKHRRKRA